MPRLLPVAVLLLAAPFAAAETKYTLKLYRYPEGSSFKKTRSITSDGTITVGEGDEKTEVKVQGREEVEYTADVLERAKDANRPAKYRRTYTKVERTDAAGAEVASHLNGKAVLVEVKDGKRAVTVDGEPPTDAQAKELETELSDAEVPTDHDLMPDHPVKLGETWEIDAKKGVALMGGLKGAEFDAKKSAFSAKLSKVFLRGEAQFGTIEYTLKYAVTKMPVGGGEAVAVEPGGTLTLTILQTTCLDGTTPGESSEMAYKLDLKAKVPGGTVHLNTTLTGTDREEPVKAKK